MKGKVIFGSPLVDIAVTRELAMETVDLCELILRLTDFDIRLLSKSPLLESVIARELERRLTDPEHGARKRVIFGLSIGTFVHEEAGAIEPNVASPQKRVEALRTLQKDGFRTFGMLCPILPQAGAGGFRKYAQEAAQFIQAGVCEAVWAEPVNFRVSSRTARSEETEGGPSDSFTATLNALTQSGCTEAARLFEEVARGSRQVGNLCPTALRGAR